MKKSSLAVFAFALLAAAAPFAALLVPPAAPTPPTDSVQADDLSPAATPQPLPTMPPSNAQNGTTIPNAALAAADITLYDADTGTNRVVSVRDFLIGAAACEMPPTWNDDTLLAQMVASHSYALALGAPMQVNSALCAGWTDTEVLKVRWGDDFTAYYSRFAALVAADMIVSVIFVPVSPSGTGNTFSSLMISFFASRLAAPARNIF